MISNYLVGSGILYNKNKSDINSINMQAMANENDQIKELKQLINGELKDCNRFLWPKVCEMQSTDKGRAKLEDMIIRYVAEEGMQIGSAIALIEQELSHIL
ncbi:MAG: hypothetical protein WAQ28_06120 [Bacteroidia bacterium]|jgi:hypothetical protein